MTGQYFFPGTPVSSTSKTDCHDITEILLKVALNTITQTLHKVQSCSNTCLLVYYIYWYQFIISTGTVTTHHTFYFFSLLEENFFLSDTTMHLFLQTNLSIKEIKDHIEGKISAYSLDSLWKVNGIKENCRYVNLI
jgi:hypothetical protein